MKESAYFGVYICPKTNNVLYQTDVKKEVCPFCGFTQPVLKDHYVLVSVYEKRYNLFEKIFLGKRNTLIAKDQPDLILVR